MNDEGHIQEDALSSVGQAPSIGVDQAPSNGVTQQEIIKMQLSYEKQMADLRVAVEKEKAGREKEKAAHEKEKADLRVAIEKEKAEKRQVQN